MKDKELIYKKVIKSIIDNNLFFIEDAVSFVAIAKSTFYSFFPLESNELNTIKELLDTNKIKEKLLLRASFRKGASVEKLALYKLICTDEERKALSMNHIDIKTGGKELNTQMTVKFVDGSKKEDE